MCEVMWKSALPESVRKFCIQEDASMLWTTPFLAFMNLNSFPCVFMDCMYCRKKSFFFLFLQKLQLHSLRSTSMMYCIFVTHFWSFKPLQIQNINALIGRTTVHFCTWVLVLPPLSSFFPPVHNSLPDFQHFLGASCVSSRRSWDFRNR